MATTDTPYIEKLATAHVEEALGHGAVDEAKNASDKEHNSRFRQTFKTHRAAVFWSCVISLSIVMEGYDTILIPNFWAYPTCELLFVETCSAIMLRRSGSGLTTFQLRGNTAGIPARQMAGKYRLHGRQVLDKRVQSVQSSARSSMAGRPRNTDTRKS